MNKPIFIVVLLSLLFFAGCASMQNNNIYEDKKIQTYLPYSDLARASHLSLNNDGYIIGIEKREREALKGIPERYYPDRFSRKPELTETNEKSQTEELLLKREKCFKKYTKYNTAMLVTHIARYFDEPDNKNFNTFRKPYFLYNAYDVYKKDNLNYENGYTALENLKTEILDNLKQKIDGNPGKRPYSHIIVFSMGWNNNQQESIYRYNRIIKNVKEVAQENGVKDFEPLVIGFTWPSVWFGIENNWLKKNTSFLFSYFTKQDDADEIGCTTANWVIHNVVLAAKEEFKDYCKGYMKDDKKDYSPRIVAIGHSMGARLLSRAIFSWEHIKPEFRKSSSASQVDLFIGLQGAFSAKRFVTDEGWEGYPYAEFSKYSTVFSLTASQYDKANPQARFFTGARHVGGKYGLAFAKKYKGVFQVNKWTNNVGTDWGKLSSIYTEDNRKVLMIDASVIVDGHDSDNGVNKPLDAHNDILDKDMAQLIWALIKNFAPFP
ncbi:MAG TPA: alpha/beta hydrolase [Candidatus Brocadiaceae bacterium]